jgi:hypothetical protein
MLKPDMRGVAVHLDLRLVGLRQVMQQLQQVPWQLPLKEPSLSVL